MKVIESLGVLIRGDLSKLPQDVDNGVKTLNRLSVKADEVSKSLSSIGTSLSLKLTAPIVAFGTFAFKKFSEFESSIVRVGQQFNLSADGLGNMTAKIREMSKTMQMEPTKMATTIKDIGDMGYDTADALKVLAASASLAKASSSDLGSAASFLTNMMKTYNIETADATKVSNQLYKIADAAGTPIETLADHFSAMASTAKLLGISLPTLGASLVTLKRTGLPASAALSGLQKLMMLMSQGKGELESVYKGLGYSTMEAAIQVKGFLGVLEEVIRKGGGASKGIADLGLRQNSLVTAQKLTTNGGKAFADSLKTISGTTGGASDMINKLDRSSSGGFARMIASVTELRLSFGQLATPVITAVIEKMTRLIDVFNNLGVKQKEFSVGALGLVAALGPVISVMASLFTVVRGIADSFALLASKLPTVASGFKLLKTIGGGTLTALTMGAGPLSSMLGGYTGTKGTEKEKWQGAKAGWMQGAENSFIGKIAGLFGGMGVKTSGPTDVAAGAAAKAARLSVDTKVPEIVTEAAVPLAPLMTEDELKAKAKFEEAVLKFKLQGMTVEQKINTLVERRKKLEEEMIGATIEKGYELKEQALDVESQIASLYSEMGGETSKRQLAGAAVKGSVEAYSTINAKDAPMSDLEKNGKEQTKELKRINTGIEKMNASLAEFNIQTVTI